MPMILVSPAFQERGYIPPKYTCKGKDISPPLSWEDPPQGVKSFALLVDDPDSTKQGIFTHWLICNIPAGVLKLAEGFPAKEKLADGTLQAKNDFGKVGYGGPCPPPGNPHRYRFNLYALDTVIDPGSAATKTQFLAAIDGHILEQSELVGLFGSEG